MSEPTAREAVRTLHPGYFALVMATGIMSIAMNYHRAHALSVVLQSANGTWFIWVVASQSVAVLAAALQPEIAVGRSELALLAVFSWSVGIFLYGAAAITVVAGARIVEMADAPMVAATRGLIAGTSVFFWAFGTWLIPPLIAAGIWRHWVHRIPLRYDATLWSVVFPLGMYGVGGHYLGQADQLPIVEKIGYTESWIALAVWLLTFVAMLHHLVVRLWSNRNATPGMDAVPGAQL
ncbi:tellurite resistance/C4-dicarboxylate transporter family protein [Mycolicibacterium boenickei]